MKITWDEKSDAYTAVAEEIRKRFNDTIESFVVELKAKYSVDDTYYRTKTLLLNEGDDWLNPRYVWEADWWEGEEDVELIAAYPIDQVDLKPNF